MLVEVIEHNARHGVAFQCDDDAHADAVGGFVVDLGDASDLPVAHLLSNAGDKVIGVDLVRKLGDNDDGAPALFLNGGHATHFDGAAAGGVGVLNTFITDDEPGRGEVGALYAFHDGLEGGGLVRVVMVEAPENCLGQLGEIVRRNIRRHTDGNTAGAVHQQVGNTRRENRRLECFAVIVGLKVDGIFADIANHLHGQRCETALCITHGCGAVVAAGAEVTLAIDQRVAHGPRLSHADQGVINGAIAVGVEVAHRVRDGSGGLDVAALGAIAVVVHRVDDAAVDGFHAVANLGESTSNDDAHGVIDVARLHFFLDVDRADAIEKVIAPGISAVITHALYLTSQGGHGSCASTDCVGTIFLAECICGFTEPSYRGRRLVCGIAVVSLDRAVMVE